MLLLLFISVNLVANVEVYQNSPKIYFYVGKIIFLPVLIGFIGLGLIANSGKLVFIKLIRYIAIFLTLLYFFVLIIDFLQIYFLETDRVFPVIIESVILILFSPLLYFMRRDFHRSRWLDPMSLPHEWEISAIRDPNSINYRPPKSPRR